MTKSPASTIVERSILLWGLLFFHGALFAISCLPQKPFGGTLALPAASCLFGLMWDSWLTTDSV